MKAYREFLDICKELKDIEEEINAYNQDDPILSEKAFAWIQRLSNWCQKNRPSSVLSNRIFGFWGWPNRENMNKLMQELLLIYYEKKVKSLKNEEFFNIIERA